MAQSFSIASYWFWENHFKQPIEIFDAKLEANHSLQPWGSKKAVVMSWAAHAQLRSDKLHLRNIKILYDHSTLVRRVAPLTSLVHPRDLESI